MNSVMNTIKNTVSITQLNRGGAEKSMAHSNPSTLISEEEMDRRLGITESDLTGFEEVEIE